MNISKYYERMADILDKTKQKISTNKNLKLFIVCLLVAIVSTLLVPNSIGQLEHIKLFFGGLVVALFGLIFREVSTDPMLKLFGMVWSLFGATLSIAVIIHIFVELVI